MERSRASRSCGLKSYLSCAAIASRRVTSFTLVWIKIRVRHAVNKGMSVTSFTLVWIKIFTISLLPCLLMSRASRSCGLKYFYVISFVGSGNVTSFTLVWIKIEVPFAVKALLDVTSFTLVWIKISSPPTAPPPLSRHELHARVD